MTLSALGFDNIIANVFVRTLIARIKEICKFPSLSESDRIISGLRWFGLFSLEHAPIVSGNPLDTLCGRLEKLLSYQPGERDLVILQHKFLIKWENGKLVGCAIVLSLIGSLTFDVSVGDPYRNGWTAGRSERLLCDGQVSWINLWYCHTAASGWRTLVEYTWHHRAVQESGLWSYS